MAAQYRLHYFDLPGRGETTRLLLTIGGIPFEDKLYAFGSPEYPEFKARTPYGQMPVLEHLGSGKLMGQSHAIERYCATLTGLLPAGDDWEVATTESVYNYFNDIWDLVAGTFKLKELPDKIKAREELLAGPLKEKLEKLSEIVAKGENGFIGGGKLSYVDVNTYNWLCQFSMGWLDGFALDCLDPYPALQAFRHRIASLPAIKAYYAGATEGFRLAYKPEAVEAFAPK